MFVFFVFLALGAPLSCGGGSKDKKESPARFEGTVDNQAVSQENDEAIPNQFSAVINNTTIVIYLMTSPTAVIYIVGETDENHKLPGALKINELTYTDGASISLYQGGTVSLDECPSEVGDIFTGKLTNVVVKDQATNATKTINGTFSVTVISATAPALVCGGSPTPDNDTPAPACGYSAEQCEGGICCPYVECYNTCFLKNCLTTCSDANQMMECLSCMQNCDSSCHSKMTPACEKALSDLNTCMDNNGCENLVDDAEVACAREHCCDELKAAFQK